MDIYHLTYVKVISGYTFGVFVYHMKMIYINIRGLMPNLSLSKKSSDNI